MRALQYKLSEIEVILAKHVIIEAKYFLVDPAEIRSQIMVG